MSQPQRTRDARGRMEDLAGRAGGCQECPLSRRRTRVVFGEGNPESSVLLIGEGPGQQEDLSGRPFVGRAGQLLDDILACVDLSREHVFITNVVKCRPPGNRDPTDGEVEACRQHLERQFQILRPRIVVALGNVAKVHLLGPAAPGITRCRGRWYRWRGGSVLMPMFHPSYLLRNDARHRDSPNWLTWQDVKELRRRYDLLQAGGAGQEEALRSTDELPDGPESSVRNDL